MEILVATKAREKLHTIIDQVKHQPVLVKGKRNTAVIMSLEAYEELQENLLVLSNRELYDSLIEASNEPIENCTKLEDFDWDNENKV